MSEASVPGEQPSVGGASLIPVIAAIGVFGVVYGAAAQPVFGTPLTVISSLVVFSGTVQFTMVGLVATATAPLAILWAVFVVNIRNFALGGAVRPHLRSDGGQRLVLSWFLIDETVGLALASPGNADRTLRNAGIAAYLSWFIGTALGVAGGATLGLEALASAVFPVLFIGLAALMVRTYSMTIRALVGGAITLMALVLWPDLGGLAPVAGGILAAWPEARP